MVGADGEAGDLEDIGRQALTTRFGDKLSKVDERRGNLLIFKVRVLHTAFLSLLEIHNFQVSQDLAAGKMPVPSFFPLSQPVPDRVGARMETGLWKTFYFGGEGGCLDRSLHARVAVGTTVELREG